MSFTIVEQCTARLNRSELAVPGSNPTFLEKAAKSPADVIFLDLEDAVAPADKVQARKNIIEALNDLDWGGRTLSVRINGLDTHYMYRDVVDILEQAPGKLDLIMIPKAGTAADIYALDMLVTQVEDATKEKKRIGFELIIETALGMMNVDELAGSSPRLESLHFGVADYAASTKARTTNIGGANPSYGVLTDQVDGAEREYHWGDMWHYAVARMVVAARAHGLAILDGVCNAIRDEDALRASCRQGRAMGFDGKTLIHPAQIAAANEVFGPSEAELDLARRTIAAFAEAEAAGRGVAVVDGRLVENLHVENARRLLDQAEAIAAMHGNAQA